MTRPPSIALVVEPRFPGGTSSAVAQELAVLGESFAVEVQGLASRMFGDRAPAGVLLDALERHRIPLRMNAPQIAADLVVLHNPSFLKLEETLAARIVARELVVVTHENLTRPGGAEAFDVAHCLRLIDRSSLAVRKSLAPVSAYNRSTVDAWLSTHPEFGHWTVLGEDWANICDFEKRAPAERPADRRGRHSRPGWEKYPGPADLDLCFPREAAANVIVGADNLLASGLTRPHWRMIPFKGIEIDKYFKMIDFMVYFTAPTCRESFGRVIAESIAAGKVVIADADTASGFAGGVIPARPAEVTGIVADLVARPDRYADHVATGQKALSAFSSDTFLARRAPLFSRLARRVA